jgi:DNA-binding response OmpR family regulator
MALKPAQVVIVLTAHDASEQHQECVLAGAVDFLSKPVDVRTLPEVCSSRSLLERLAQSEREPSPLIRSAPTIFRGGDNVRNLHNKIVGACGCAIRVRFQTA